MKYFLTGLVLVLGLSMFLVLLGMFGSLPLIRLRMLSDSASMPEVLKAGWLVMGSLAALGALYKLGKWVLNNRP